MSGVLMALFVFAAVLLAHLAFPPLFRFQRKERMLVSFMIGAIGLDVAAYPIALPALTRAIGPSPLPLLLDFAAGLAALGFLVLGYVEFWSIIERSFSLRLLIDLSEAPEGLTREQIAKSYSGGRGVRWLMEKRVGDPVRSGPVQQTDGGLS